MATIGELIINLKADTASFAGDLTRAKNLSFDTAAQIQRSFTILGAAAVGMVTAAAGAMVAVIDKTAEFDTHILHLSESAGVTTETMSGLAFAAKQLGMNADEVAQALERFDKQLVGAQQGNTASLSLMDKLGIDPAQIQTSDQALMKLADHFSVMPDGVIKSGEAMQAFGKAGAAMVPILDQGSTGLKAFMDQAKSLGVIVDQNTAKSFESFEQNVTTIETAFEGLGMQVAKQLIPTLENFSDQIAKSGPQLLDFASTITLAVKDLLNLADALVFVGRASAAFWQLTSGFTPFSPTKIKEFNAAINQAYADMNRFDAFAAPTKSATDFSDIMGKLSQRLMENQGHLAEDAAAAKKLNEEVQSLTQRLGEDVAAFGLTGDAAAIAKTKFRGATDEMLAQAQASAGLKQALETLQDRQKFAASNPYMPAGGYGPLPVLQLNPQMADIKGQYDDLYEGVTKNEDALRSLAQQIEDKGTPAFDRYQKIVEQANEAQIEFGLTDQQVSVYLKDVALQMGLTQEKGSAAGEKLGKAWRQLGDQLANDFASLITGGKSFVTVLQDILKQVEELLIKQALFGASGTGGPGSGGLFGFLGSLGGLFGGGGAAAAAAGGGAISMSGGALWTGFHASGGTMDAGQVGVVGDAGPELWVPDRSGTIIPNGQGLGGGVTMHVTHNIDARGADPGVEPRIRRMLADSENRTVNRAVAAVHELNRRRSAGI